MKIAICDDKWEITQQIKGMVRKGIPGCEMVCYRRGEDLLEGYGVNTHAQQSNTNKRTDSYHHDSAK